MAHPKDRPAPIDRRAFLQRAAAAGVALPSMAAILAACGSSEPSGGSGDSPQGLQLARPDSPVTLPVIADNAAIADGLDPEAGPLKIFGYNDYIWKKVRNGFAEKLGVDVEYTVFDTPDEMVSKMQSNGADFDLVVTVTLENIGKLAQGGLIQPLNKTYLTTAEDQLAEGVPDFYDVGRRYSMPYVIFTTGIAWRNDEVTEDIGERDNPWDVFWDTKYKGQAHLLNGSRDTLGGRAPSQGVRPQRERPGDPGGGEAGPAGGRRRDGLEVRPRGLHGAQHEPVAGPQHLVGTDGVLPVLPPQRCGHHGTELRLAPAGPGRAEGPDLPRPVRRSRRGRRARCSRMP